MCLIYNLKKYGKDEKKKWIQRMILQINFLLSVIWMWLNPQTDHCWRSIDLLITFRITIRFLIREFLNIYNFVGSPNRFLFNRSFGDNNNIMPIEFAWEHLTVDFFHLHPDVKYICDERKTLLWIKIFSFDEMCDYQILPWKYCILMNFKFNTYYVYGKSK